MISTPMPKRSIESSLEFKFIPSADAILRPQKSAILRAYRKNALIEYRKNAFPSIKEDLWKKFDLYEFRINGLELAGSKEKGSRSNDQKVSTIDFKKMGVGAYLQGSPNRAILHLSADFSTKGIVFTDLASAEQDHPELLEKVVGKLIKSNENKFTSLVAALAQYGAFLFVPSGVKIERPIIFEQNHANSMQVGLSQLIIFVGQNAEVTFVHHMSSNNDKADPLQINTTEIYLESDAKCSFHEVIDSGGRVVEISQERARLEKNAELNWIVGSLGNRYEKRILDIELVGQNSKCHTMSFSFSKENQRTEFDTRTWHLAPDTTSNLILKNVLIDKSETTWRGMIHVAQNAIKSDGYQANRNLVLNKNVKVESVPGLEILTDDVRCSHGSTTSGIDQEEMFYLQSRGIPDLEAQKLIVEGFVAPIIDQYPEGFVRDETKNAFQKRYKS